MVSPFYVDSGFDYEGAERAIAKLVIGTEGRDNHYPVVSGLCVALDFWSGIFNRHYMVASVPNQTQHPYRCDAFE